LSKIKILQVITLSETGGAQKVLYYLAAGLPPGIFDVTVVCGPGGKLVRWLKEHGHVRVIEMPQLCRNISPLKDIAAFRGLYRFIRRESFDIVHCHSSKAGILGRLAASLAGVQNIIFTVHGWGITPGQNSLTKMVYILAERWAGMRSTRVVCVSKADLERGLKDGLAPPSRLEVIYNGVPLPETKKGSLRAELGLAHDDLLVGCVGRLSKQKNPLYFLDVARYLLSGPCSTKRLYFVLIGDGPLKRECMDFIEQNNLHKNIFLLGNRENAAGLAADFDIFCLLSLWEGLPLTIIEAMFNARPVVATNVGGVSELVIEGENGYLVSPGDKIKTVLLLSSLIGDGELREKMGRAGYLMARDKFSLKKMVDQYTSLYIK